MLKGQFHLFRMLCKYLLCTLVEEPPLPLVRFRTLSWVPPSPFRTYVLFEWPPGERRTDEQTPVMNFPLSQLFTYTFLMRNNFYKKLVYKKHEAESMQNQGTF